MSEENTAPEPLKVELDAIYYAFLVAEHADALVNALIEHKPTTQIIKTLAAMLFELQGFMPDATIHSHAYDLANVFISMKHGRVELIHGQLCFWEADDPPPQ